MPEENGESRRKMQVRDTIEGKIEGLKGESEAHREEMRDLLVNTTPLSNAAVDAALDVVQIEYESRISLVVDTLRWVIGDGQFPIDDA